MPTIYPGPLQTAILFDADHPAPERGPNWAKLLIALNEQLRPLGIKPFNNVMQNQPGVFALVNNGAFHISVGLRPDQAMDLRPFDRVMGSIRFAQMQPELVEAVMDHEGHLLLEVGLGTVPFPTEHELIKELNSTGMLDSLGLGEDQAKFEQRLTVTRLFARLLAKAAPGSVLHWGQSDQLFTMDAFQAFSEGDHPTALFVHPLFHSDGAQRNGDVMAGVIGLGSEFLLGKKLVFAPHEQPMMESYQLMLGFIDFCRMRGSVIPDGESFGRTADEKIYVYHRGPTEMIPEDHIELVKQNPEDQTGRKKTVYIDYENDGTAKAPRMVDGRPIPWERARPARKRPDAARTQEQEAQKNVKRAAPWNTARPSSKFTFAPTSVPVVPRKAGTAAPRPAPELPKLNTRRHWPKPTLGGLALNGVRVVALFGFLFVAADVFGLNGRMSLMGDRISATNEPVRLIDKPGPSDQMSYVRE